MRAFLLAIVLFLTSFEARAETDETFLLPTQEYLGIVCNNEVAARHLGSYFFEPQQETGYYPFASFLFTAMRANTCFVMQPYEVNSSVMVSEVGHWLYNDHRLTMVRFSRITSNGQLVIYYGFYTERGWVA